MTKNSNSGSIPAKTPYFSVIIPVRSTTKYLRENLRRLKKVPNTEVLVITDKISKSPNPASKRNLGAKMSKGKVLVFLDDDSYPDQNYFSEAKKIFKSGTQVACGPQLTPPGDNLYQKASGLLLSSYLGSGGAGVFRNQPKPKRFVDDYPSVNLLVKKTIFKKVKGFDQEYWPGEDTLFCRKLVQHNFKILYTPKLVVFHHRRAIGLAFLKQQSRYGLHRGYFAKKYPENSAKLGYMIPSLFTLYCLFSPIFPIPLYFYIFLLILQFINFIFAGNNIYSSLLATLFIPATHLTYGTFFIIGLFKKEIYFTPHKTDQSGNYIGG